jgi:hypothetical protein
MIGIWKPNWNRYLCFSGMAVRVRKVLGIFAIASDLNLYGSSPKLTTLKITLPRKTKEGRHRLSVSHDLYLTLQAVAEKEGRPMSQVMIDAVAAYLKQSAT